MFCEKCGNEIPEGAFLCDYCGTPVHQNTNSSGPDSGHPSNEPQGEQMIDYGRPLDNLDSGAVGLSITSMILGIIALLLSCCLSIGWLIVILSILSIVLGAVAIGQNRGGKGMAVSGIVCSAVAISMMILVKLIGVALIAVFFSALS